MSQADKAGKTAVVLRAFSPAQGIVPLETLELSPAEKLQLKVLMNNPVFIRAMNVAETKKPSLFTGNDATAEQDAKRLAEIRGWESFQAALMFQSQVEQWDFGQRKTTEYTWQDTGEEK